MTSVSKKVNYKKKNLQIIPLNVPSTDSITEIDFSYNPITSFENLPYIENLTKLIIDSTKISTFHYAPCLPNLESFSCRNTPLGSSSHIGLMSAIVFGDKLKQVNNSPIDDRVLKIANYYREQYRDFFTDGYLIINLSPIRIFNPETRKRQTIFGDFSQPPKASTKSSSKAKTPKQSNVLSSPSKIPRSSHIITHESLSPRQPPLKKKSKMTVSEVTKSTAKKTVPDVSKNTTKKAPSARISTTSISSKSKHTEIVVEVYDETEKPEQKESEIADDDIRLKQKYLTFTKHLLKQTVKQRRDLKNGIVPRKKTPLQLELESNEKNSDYSDDEFYGKKGKAQSKTSEMLQKNDQEKIQEENLVHEQFQYEVPKQEEHTEEVQYQIQNEDEVQEHPEEELPEQKNYKEEEEAPESNQHEEEPLEQQQFEEELNELKQYEEEFHEQEQSQQQEEIATQEQNQQKDEQLLKSQDQDDQQILYSDAQYSEKNQYSEHEQNQYSKHEQNHVQNQNNQQPGEQIQNNAPKTGQNDASDYYYSDDEYDNPNLPSSIPPNNKPGDANAPKPQNTNNGEYDDYYSEYDEIKL